MSKKKASFNIENKAGKAYLSITGFIGGWKTNAESFTNKVNDLLEAGVEDVEGYINSYGGSTFDGIEIGNQVKRFPGKKTVKVGSVAASMASGLIPVFDTAEGHSNTQVMMHDPIMRPEIKSEDDFETNKQLYVNTKNNLIDLYASKMNLTKKKIAAMMKKTTWLNAQQCVDNGLFNGIINKEDSLIEDAVKLTNFYNSELPTQLVAAIESTNQPNNKNKNQNDMKTVLLALGLPETATEAQALEAVNASKENGINALTALGEAKGMKKEHITKLANADFDVAMEIVAEHVAVTPVVPGTPAPVVAVVPGTPAPVVPEKPAPVVPEKQVNIVDAIAAAMKGGAGGATKKKEDYSPAELEALCESDPVAYGKLVGIS